MKTNKATNIIRTLAAVIGLAGLFVAVCTVDGTPNEISIRLAGTAVFGLGMLMSGAIGGGDHGQKED